MVERANLRTAPIYASNKTPFNAGNVKARWYDVNGNDRVHEGQLPHEFVKQLQDDIHKQINEGDGKLFVIQSYRTPIGWFGNAVGWRKPRHRYSNSTTRHQKAVPDA